MADNKDEVAKLREENTKLREALKAVTTEIGLLQPGQTPKEDAVARFHRVADQARGALES